MKALWVGALMFLLVGTAYAQADPPTELEDCAGPGADFCYVGVSAFIDSACGPIFESYQSRISWPILKNAGPVTIAVQTFASLTTQTFLPLYVEVVRRPDTGCKPWWGGEVILVAQGGFQCGGTWESVGPVDLADYGIPLGSNYSIAAVFFRYLTPTPFPPGVRTAGFSCIRVTSHPTVVSGASWGLVKQLYRDPGKQR